jgi:hypothetical protein
MLSIGIDVGFEEISHKRVYGPLPSCGQLAVANERSGWRLLAFGANV